MLSKLSQGIKNLWLKISSEKPQDCKTSLFRPRKFSTICNKMRKKRWFLILLRLFWKTSYYFNIFSLLFWRSQSWIAGSKENIYNLGGLFENRCFFCFSHKFFKITFIRMGWEGSITSPKFNWIPVSSLSIILIMS